MHDIKCIRQNPEAFDERLERRGLEPLSAKILALDEEKRTLQTAIQNWQSQKNKIAKEIGIALSKGDKEKADELKLQVADAGEQVHHQKLEDCELELKTILETIPDLPADDVPFGTDEHGNVILRYHGEKPKLGFSPKLHDEVEAIKKLMDFDAAAKLSGARFVVLRGQLARMERALANFMLDIHTNEFGYTEILPPMLVKDNAVYGTGQLPKFSEDLFKTENGYWLIPTAEVPLTNLVADSIIETEQLPIRMTAYTPCFRSEAGAAGKDTRGMIRQHQFTKVELVSIVTADQSLEEHERMTSAAEEILKRLGLHYRVVLLCTGDMGFCAQKTYDLEVWMPGQNAYREISSCSNCGAFQARRMKARTKAKGAKETEFIHTLNGSGLAIGRTMVAIIENYQQADGSIMVPEALRPYMGGVEAIGK